MPQQNVTFTDVGYQPDLAEAYRTAQRHVRRRRWTCMCFAAKRRRLTSAGISVAFPEYRLGAAPRDIEDDTRARMQALEDKAHQDFPVRFRREEAMAALEDGAAASRWLEARRTALKIAGPIVLAGSSAGAITALNLLYLAPELGWDLPPIGGVLAISGGFAFPGLSGLSDRPVLALHNPDDDRVPATPIMALAKQRDAVSLVLSREQMHGDFRLSPNERKGDAFDRLTRTVHGFVTGSANDADTD